MIKYYAHADSVDTESKRFDYFVEVYLADHVDARIAELEQGNKVLRDELNRDENVMEADQARIAELEKALREVSELGVLYDRDRELARRIIALLKS